MHWLGKNKSGIGIVRVSSRKQQDNISHELQEDKIKSYSSENNIDLLKVVRITESAKRSDERKRYSETIQFALNTNIKHILFYMNDREARNLTDSETNENLVLDGKIIVHYVNELKVLHKNSPSSDFFTRDIYAVTNKHFSRVLSEKIIDVMERKAEEGWFPGNRPPLGYEHSKLTDSDGKTLKRGTIITPSLNNNNVKIVQYEFELRSRGLSYDEIRKQVVSSGLIDHKKVTSYSRAAIEQRLKNPFYRGRFEWREKSYNGKHELIISTSILEKVDNTFGKSKRPINIKDNVTVGIFSGGWLKCAAVGCSCNIVYDPKVKNYSSGPGKTYHYYHCTNGKKIHLSMKGMNVSEEQLWKDFSGSLDGISISQEWAQQISNAMNEAFLKTKSIRRKEIETYRAALIGLEKHEDEAYRHFCNGILDESAYKRRIQHIRNERARFTDLLNITNEGLDDSCRETANSILELATNAKSLWLERSPVERRGFLDKILSNPRLNGLSVQYDYKTPFGVIAKMTRDSEWRSRLVIRQCHLTLMILFTFPIL